jgi:hypothetical protein
MVMGSETKNDCPGEDQQEITSPDSCQGQEQISTDAVEAPLLKATTKQRVREGIEEWKDWNVLQLFADCVE